MIAEALLVVAVLLVVGRLVGQEPARATLASQQPTHLVVPLAFATPDGSRPATLTLTPGATGVNTFTLTVDGAALPEGSEGVLRFTPPNQDLGGQELRLPRDGPNQFAAQGAPLALPGDWQLTVIVRKIGAFSWETQTPLSIEETPPPVADLNPAPHFTQGGVAGVLAVAIGLVGLTIAALTRGVAPQRRWGTAGAGAAALVVGAALLAGSRLPSEASVPALVLPASPIPASPAMSPMTTPAHDHAVAMSAAATPVALAGAGTPVPQDGLVVTVTTAPAGPGPIETTIEVRDAGGTPISDAHIVLFAEMAAMGKVGEGITAEEVAPGRYLARDVPLTMSGDWKLTVRVSPKGGATQTVAVALSVP